MVKICVLGNKGFVGKIVERKLKEKGISYCGTDLPEVDCRDTYLLIAYLKKEKPDVIINCAAFVGGIPFTAKYPANIVSNNMKLCIALFEASDICGIKKIINPISNCTYPADSSIQRVNEWWNGKMHESVLSYSASKKMFWVFSWAYAKQFNLDTINIILPNMYGEGEHTDPERAHALSGMIMRMIEAKKNNDKEFVIWGTGKPVRDWMYIEDGVEALIKAIDIKPQIEPINVGTGIGICISSLAGLIKNEIGYNGELVFDTTKQDGAMCKIVLVDKAKELLNWKPKTNLIEGVRRTVKWYMEELK